MAKLTLPTGPAPVATGVTVAGRFTWTGTSLLTVLALPSSPSSLRPQASTCPLLVRARLWLQPALTSVATVSCGSPAMTGTSLSWVLSLPSCPSALNPQASTWPVLVRARVCSQPAESCRTVVPGGSVTMTGVSLLLLSVPLPSSPCRPNPQASTWPVLVRARLCASPALIAFTVVPVGRLTGTGVWLSVVVPLPSSPLVFKPQASTWPVVVKARLWKQPARIALIVVPAGMWTFTGVARKWVVPSPSSPDALEPQASTWPVLVKARVWKQPARTDVTLVPAGSLTLTGTVLVCPVPLPSWPLPPSPQARSVPLTAAVAAPLGAWLAAVAPPRDSLGTWLAAVAG